MNQLINFYILFLGMMLLFLGLIEFFIPLKVFSIWKKWTCNRFFFIHGIVLIISGFPLTLYNDPINKLTAKIIFFIGIIIVFTGPFIILFPERLKGTFQELSENEDKTIIRRFIYIDAIFRSIAGIVLVYGYLVF